MKVNWFNSLDSINWKKLLWLTGILTVFWLGLVTIVPIQWYQPISVVLAAVQSALMFASRGTKYVEERVDTPLIPEE